MSKPIDRMTLKDRAAYREYHRRVRTKTPQDGYTKAGQTAYVKARRDIAREQKPNG